MNTLTKNLKLVLGMAIAIVACTEARQKTEEVEDAVAKRVASEAQKTYRTITTPIKSINGSGLRGEATFKELENGAIDLTVRLNGVSPGEHAVHLHENGDCSAVDGSSAGGHWNPMDVSHGHRLEDEQFHLGDIGNITVGADSSGLFTMEVEGWTIGGDSTSNILQKAIIIHAGPDDFISQPSGAAGSRIGCGVIKL